MITATKKETKTVKITASVNGISFRRTARFSGMEGDGCEGKLRLGGRIIGTVTDPADGGEFMYTFVSPEDEKLFDSTAEAYFGVYRVTDYSKLDVTPEEYLRLEKDGKLPYEDPADMFMMRDCFASELMELEEHAKTAAKMAKKGYGALAVYDCHSWHGPRIYQSCVSFPRSYTQEKIRDTAAECLAERKAKAVSSYQKYLFMKPEDFAISVPAKA